MQAQVADPPVVIQMFCKNLVWGSALENSGGPARRQGKLYALQGLRGVAAFLVVIDHIILTGVDKFGISSDFTPYAYVLGAVGVQIFFVISGFVMIVSHGNDFLVRNSPVRFGVRRITRIVPLYWLVTFVQFVKEGRDMSFGGALIH